MYFPNFSYFDIGFGIGFFAHKLYKNTEKIQDIDRGRGRVMKWLGLTGGIASGKSTVSRLLSGLGIPVIDADVISHDLTQVGAEGYIKVVQHFGDEILGAKSQINRKQLGAIVFNHPEKRLELENILHPLVQGKVKNLRESYRTKGHALCFYDVPLLFEKKLQDQFDKTILIYAPIGLQIRRLMERNHLSHAEAMMRLKSQIPLREKVKLADFCLDNSTHIHDLELQVEHLLKILRL